MNSFFKILKPKMIKKIAIIFVLIFLKLYGWEVVQSNSYIRDSVTLYDFVPLGVALKIDTLTNILTLPGDSWRASNWVPFGMGYTPDSSHSLWIHSSINIDHGTIRLRFDQTNLFLILNGPVFYDTTGIYFPYPTVYTNPSDNYMNIIAFDEANRTWYYKILKNTPPETTILYLIGHTRSIPLWMGKAEGPYIVQGVYPDTFGIDCWGGYIDFGEMTVSFYHPSLDTTFTFSGQFFMDREYHRTYIGSVGGAPLEFKALSMNKINGEVIDLLVIKAFNPVPDSFSNIPFEWTGRINFVTRELDYTFDNFLYWDNGGLQPDTYSISGYFDNGYVEIHGKAIGFFPNPFYPDTGTWWDENGIYSWGRSFVKWNGFIILGNDTISINNVLGWREATHYIQGTFVEEKRVISNQKPKILSFINGSKIKIVSPFSWNGPIYINIYDVSGREVLSEFRNRFSHMLILKFPQKSGIYFLKIKFGKEGFINIFKIITMKAKP